MHIRNSTCLIIKGRPVLDGTKDDDCCVCYGVGIGNRDCMFKWLGISVVSRLGWQNSNLRLRPIPTCPICRGEIIFEVIQKNLLEKEEIIEGKNKNNWLRKLGALIKDWRNVMDWRWIIVRVEVTTVYILMVWRILKWREKIIRSLTYYNRNLTNS
ncbi:hypothetical protein RhiirC2_134356 [Rhizophagus irregularis]|uniref:Uncharacterized protein n=1 Tax=Rhizophagus irregularis TaxID=588596 RepID=A0A2N1MPN2_9GLOM|nr:hypothetical protein RhiirC2_134356 [Rhizophagus irregularis]